MLILEAGKAVRVFSFRGPELTRQKMGYERLAELRAAITSIPAADRARRESQQGPALELHQPDR